MGTNYARTLDMRQRLGVELGKTANVSAPYALAVQGRLLAAKDWAAWPLNPTVGPERSVPPQALSTWFLAQHFPFTALDDWLKPEAARFDVPYVDWRLRTCLRLARRGT